MGGARGKTLSGSGTSYELNLGSVEQYSDPLVAGYGVENDGIIPADLLSGSFLDEGSSQFLNSGLSPFAPIAGRWLAGAVFVVLVACCVKLTALALEELPQLATAAEDAAP